jgi:hypothetical protein
MAYQGPTIVALLVLMSLAPLLAGCNQKVEEAEPLASTPNREHPEHNSPESHDSSAKPY